MRVVSSKLSSIDPNTDAANFTSRRPDLEQHATHTACRPRFTRRLLLHRVVAHLDRGPGLLIRIDGRRAVAPELATESEQMVVHQTADHIESQQDAVRPMTDRPHESAEVEIS